MLIYLVTNQVNGMKYVGLTRRSRLEPRINEHFAKARNSTKGGIRTLSHAIRMHGEHAFVFEVLDELDSLKALSKAERYWIQKLNTRHPNGYNVKKGGCPTFKLAAGDIYEIDNKKYYGCGDLAEHFPVSVHNIRHRILRAGWTARQAVELDAPPERKRQSVFHGSPNCTAITVEGRKFGSIEDACRHYHVRSNRYHSRKRNGWTDEEALEVVPRNPPTQRVYSAITVAGNDFPSIAKAAEHYGLRSGCVQQRLAQGWTVDEAFELSTRYCKPNSKSFAGYKSISDAARQTGIGSSTISWRLRKGWSPEQALGIAPMHGNNQSTRI